TFAVCIVVAARDQQAGRVGWINPARVCTANAGPIFTIDRGYNGDGVGAYLGLTTNLSALTKFTQDNACLGVWIANNAIGVQSVIGTPTTNRISIGPRNASDQMNTRLNSSG